MAQTNAAYDRQAVIVTALLPEFGSRVTFKGRTRETQCTLANDAFKIQESKNRARVASIKSVKRDANAKTRLLDIFSIP